MKKLLIVGLVMAMALAFIGCPDGNGGGGGNGSQTTEIEREFTVQMLGKDITVKDMRTGENDQSLEALGIVEKLQAGINRRADWLSDKSDELKNMFNTVLAKGVIIEVQGTGTSFDGFKTKADGRTMVAHINYLDTATEDDIYATIPVGINDLNNGVVTAGSQTTEIQREFTLTTWGNSITVKDARTGAEDKTLEELGVMQKLQDGLELVKAQSDSEERKQGFNRMLAKGVTIVLEVSDGSYVYYKTKPADDVLIINLDRLLNPEASDNVGAWLYAGIGNFLDQGTDHSV